MDYNIVEVDKLTGQILRIPTPISYYDAFNKLSQNQKSYYPTEFK